ncbi:MAG TPA: class I SAM-dependent methyltransferase [Polyangiaceae bacterium]|nr:class I SAM-dependent methyltransferase [Polyangiaceae bacterium]
MSERHAALLALGRRLLAERYRFVTITPSSHALVEQRPGARVARDLRDVFGWNRAFNRELLSGDLFELMQVAEVCRQLADGHWQATVRFSTLEDQLFVHSAFPTSSADAVFFGPDSYRFVRAILRYLPEQGRLVDVGCGSGVGGIVAAKHAHGRLEAVLADINPAALAMARVNAALAGVRAEVVQSDVLAGVQGELDVVISNPPYLVDAEHRAYRDGGSHHGAALAIRIVSEALTRLANGRHGGRLLLYTGAAIVGDRDCFFEQVEPLLRRYAAEYSYEELDPDVFGEELALPAYSDVERIAVTFLRATV